MLRRDVNKCRKQRIEDTSRSQANAHGIYDQSAIEVLKDDATAVSCNTHGFDELVQIVANQNQVRAFTCHIRSSTIATPTLAEMEILAFSFQACCSISNMHERDQSNRRQFRCNVFCRSIRQVIPDVLLKHLGHQVRNASLHSAQQHEYVCQSHPLPRPIDHIELTA